MIEINYKNSFIIILMILNTKEKKVRNLHISEANLTCSPLQPMINS